jgi:hypothetical protein
MHSGCSGTGICLDLDRNLSQLLRWSVTYVIHCAVRVVPHRCQQNIAKARCRQCNLGTSSNGDVLWGIGGKAPRIYKFLTLSE